VSKADCEDFIKEDENLKSKLALSMDSSDGEAPQDSNDDEDDDEFNSLMK